METIVKNGILKFREEVLKKGISIEIEGVENNDEIAFYFLFQGMNLIFKNSKGKSVKLNIGDLANEFGVQSFLAHSEKSVEEKMAEKIQGLLN
jgi:hypothetical protein